MLIFSLLGILSRLIGLFPGKPPWTKVSALSRQHRPGPRCDLFQGRAEGLETKTLDWASRGVLGSNWARFKGRYAT